MKTSTSVVQATLKTVFDGYDGDIDDLSQFAAFLLEIAGR